MLTAEGRQSMNRLPRLLVFILGSGIIITLSQPNWNAGVGESSDKEQGVVLR